MRNSKNANAKNSNANAKNQKSDLIKINLSEFKKKSEKMQFSEKGKSFERGDLLYNYPEGWGKMQINGMEGKSFRNKCRDMILNYAERIGLFIKKDRIEDLQNELKEFMQFYKEKYRIQDFQISHFSNIKDEIKREKISLLLDIAKEYFPSKENKKIAKKNPIAKKRNPAKKKIAENPIQSPIIENKEG